MYDKFIELKKAIDLIGDYLEKNNTDDIEGAIGYLLDNNLITYNEIDILLQAIDNKQVDIDGVSIKKIVFSNFYLFLLFIIGVIISPLFFKNPIIIFVFPFIFVYILHLIDIKFIGEEILFINRVGIIVNPKYIILDKERVQDFDFIRWTSIEWWGYKSITNKLYPILIIKLNGRDKVIEIKNVGRYALKYINIYAKDKRKGV